MNNYKDKLRDFLNPDILKKNLIISSLFIAVFDNFKSTIIEQVKFFYFSGMEKGKFEFKGYKQEVLDKVGAKKNRQIRATILWLKNINAMDENDEKKFKELTEMRNKLAHEMTKMLFDGFPSEIYDLYFDMIKLFNKFTKWWINEIEIPINVNIYNIEKDRSYPLNITFIKVMSEIAFNGSDRYMKMAENIINNKS